MGALLRELREERGESLRSAADHLGVAPSHLSRLERGQRQASADLTHRVADYYGTTTEFIEMSRGQLPPDVVEILLANPDLVRQLRETYGEVATAIVRE